MNQTILALHLSFILNGPVMTVSNSMFHRITNLQAINLHNFVHSFFITTKNIEFISKYSSFSNFLHTPLQFSSIDFYRVNTEDHLFSYGVKSPSIYVLESRFRNCVSFSTNGGAIFFDQKVISIVIAQNSFVKCKTNKCGGAFFGSVSDALVTRNYFDSCTAIENGHAFTIHQFTINDETILTENLITECGLYKKVFGMAAINVLLGISKMRMLNMTSCHAALMSSCISHVIQKETSLSFSNIVNCSGSCVIKTFNINNASHFGFCNFFANTNKDCMFQLEASNYFIGCIFAYNIFPIFSSASPSSRMTMMEIFLLDCILDFGVKELGDNEIFYELSFTNIITTSDPKSISLQFGVEREGIPLRGEKGEFDKMMRNIVPDKHRSIFFQYFQIEHLIPSRRDKAYANSSHNLHVVEATPNPTRTPFLVLEEEDDDEIEIDNVPFSNEKKNGDESDSRIDENEEKFDNDNRTFGKFNIPNEGQITTKSNKSQDEIKDIRQENQRTIQENTRSGIMKIRKDINIQHDTEMNKSIDIERKLDLTSSSKERQQSPIPQILLHTNTFSSSIEFSVSLEPSVIIVPYIMYSSAMFVVIAVLASFYFINIPESGYGIIDLNDKDESSYSIEENNSNLKVATSDIV
ncbi:hypothetical protein TRFO_28601 [Tritrichomonas foetus]|uniref:Right handed beta helix domain-containing protein n=1 Tax=Tritrichomonas foetus TaxID=1144522 RepID=A0A1J4JXW9_9EUKA|nr:hypothetical protein TRFO_28601 [Tritrichomonas foetus]|eukprot:OHT04001.1 hypothetical protein TRFO_28601 [Tritrichomonas foetus]